MSTERSFAISNKLQDRLHDLVPGTTGVLGLPAGGGRGHH